MGDEFLALEKYVNLNYMGFHKILVGAGTRLGGWRWRWGGHGDVEGSCTLQACLAGRHGRECPRVRGAAWQWRCMPSHSAACCPSAPPPPPPPALPCPARPQKKHDKMLPHTPCRQFYISHLHNQPWVQVGPGVEGFACVVVVWVGGGGSCPLGPCLGCGWAQNFTAACRATRAAPPLQGNYSELMVILSGVFSQLRGDQLAEAQGGLAQVRRGGLACGPRPACRGRRLQLWLWRLLVC